MCGKIFDPDQVVEENKNPYLDDDEMPKKVPSFCQMCEAKIRNESNKLQKEPKPM